ncbi:MAG: alpha/beta fold hydrolase [Acidimicrobiales bacterium]
MHDQGFAEAQAKALEHYGIVAEERWIAAPTVHGQAHVLVTGQGPPVVLLNGIGVPAAMLAPLMARIEGFTQYAVDLPAYGLSDSDPSFTDDLRANAVRFLSEVLDGLDLDRPIVVANSLGSLWASWLAFDQPGRVAGLAHIGCPAIVLDTSAPLPMRLLSARPLGRLIMRVQPPSERQVEQLAKMVHEHPLPVEIGQLVLATERLDHFEDTFLSTLHQLLRLRGNRPDLALTSEQLARIDAPTLLVFADDDPMGDEGVGERVARAMPNAQLHVVEGGHAPWLHHADQIAPALAAFLLQVSPPTG